MENTSPTPVQIQFEIVAVKDRTLHLLTIRSNASLSGRGLVDAIAHWAADMQAKQSKILTPSKKLIV